MKLHRVLLLMAALMLVLPATAVGQGNTKSSESSSQAGLCLGGEGLGDDIVEVSCSETESTTNHKEGAEAGSEATPLGLLELIELNEKACAAPGALNSGRVRDEKEETALIGQEGFALLSSACEATAVQGNNSESSAKTSLLAAEQEGVGSLVVAESEAGKPDESDNQQTRTTSGNARSSAEFTLVQAEGGDMSLTVLNCTSESFAAQNRQETETDGDLITSDGEEAEEFDPLADALCGLFVSSEASHSKG